MVQPAHKEPSDGGTVACTYVFERRTATDLASVLGMEEISTDFRPEGLPPQDNDFALIYGVRFLTTADLIGDTDNHSFIDRYAQAILSMSETEIPDLTVQAIVALSVLLSDVCCLRICNADIPLNLVGLSGNQGVGLMRRFINLVCDKTIREYPVIPDGMTVVSLRNWLLRLERHSALYLGELEYTKGLERHTPVLTNMSCVLIDFFEDELVKPKSQNPKLPPFNHVALSLLIPKCPPELRERCLRSSNHFTLTDSRSVRNEQGYSPEFVSLANDLADRVKEWLWSADSIRDRITLCAEAADLLTDSETRKVACLFAAYDGDDEISVTHAKQALKHTKTAD